jgi:NitT/TauT family transport system substrate-binding protein
VTNSPGSPRGGLSRRRFLGGSALMAGGVAFGGAVLSACASNASSSASGGGGGGGGLTKLNYQIAWVGDNGVLGEVVALEKGYYKDAGLDINFVPGGPSVDPVTMVAGGSSQVGQTSSSPAIMLARSQGEPVKAFATGLQEHPYAYISLPKNPVHKPQDLVGKTVGIQATGQILLNALLAKNNIDPNSVKVQVLGSDFTPLATGRVDVMTGWVTNLQALSILPQYEAMRLWDAGIHLYANLYLATDSTLQQNAKAVQSFAAATAKGWDYARQNPEDAAAMLVKKYPSLDKNAQLAAGKKLMTFMFTSTTAQNGWGSMDPNVWQEQLDTWKQLGQFKGTTPKNTDVMTLDVLKATADQRPKAESA